MDQKIKTIIDDQEVAPDAVTAAAWKLMPAAMQKDLQKQSTRVSQLIARYCVHFRAANSAGVNFSCRGLYMTPMKSIESLLGELKQVDEEMRRIVDVHTADMHAFKEAIRTRMKDEAAYRLAADKIPGRAEMLNTTGVWYMSFPLNTDGNGRTGVSRIRTGFLADARQKADRMLDGLAETLVNEPRRELSEALQQLYTLAVEDRNVTAKSIRPVLRSLEKLKLFSFTEDATTRAALDALANRLDDLTPTELSSDAAAMKAIKDAGDFFANQSPVRRRRIGSLQEAG